MPNPLNVATPEKVVRVASGWPLLFLDIALFLGAPLSLLLLTGVDANDVPAVLRIVFLAVALVLSGMFLAFGFFTLQPNEARVLILFGHYRGTARSSGFHWANPF